MDYVTTVMMKLHPKEITFVPVINSIPTLNEAYFSENVQGD